MAYCSEADIKKKIPSSELEQLIDDTGSDSAPDKTARITAAISNADSKINAFCGQKYTVPFSTVPDVVKDLSVDISIWWLASRRWNTIDMQSTIKMNNDKAISLLEKISKGTVVLSVPDPAKNPNKVAATVITSSSRILSRDSLKGF